MLLKKRMERNLPARSEFIAWAQVVELTSVSPDRLEELIDIGWLEPVVTRESEHLFRLRDVYRLRKLERICHDFDASSLTGSIIVDLLERIEELENRVQALRRLL